MPTISYRNPFVDTNNPTFAILNAETKNIPQIYSFPKGVNEFPVPGQPSTHSIIFTANKFKNFVTSGTLATAEERDKNRTVRIKEAKTAFCFYMPTPIIFNNAIDYAQTSLTDRVLDAAQRYAGVLPQKGIGSAADDIIGGIPNLAKLLGYPLTPKIEVIFENIQQRQYSFEFLFAPVNEAETNELKKMIQALRATSAPKRATDDGGKAAEWVNAFVWNAPDTVDVQFFHNGVENLNIPKVDECVIEQIDVDYSPGGQWVTFRNGYPVQIRMRINLRERDPNDRAMIERGY